MTGTNASPGMTAQRAPGSRLPPPSSPRFAAPCQTQMIGLVEGRRSAHDRFEVDGADAPRHFLLSHGLDGEAAPIVCDAIALHTPVVACAA